MLRIRRIRVAALSTLLGIASAAVLPGAVAHAVDGGAGVAAAAASAAVAPASSSLDVPPEVGAPPAPAVAPAAVAPAPAPAPAAAPVPPAPAPAVPTTPAPAPAAAPAAVGGQEATVSIPSVGINLPVVLGGQSVIDQGIAAHYRGPGWKAPVPAGSPGTYWLAAHHETHGSPFGNLPAVRAGARIIVITTSGHTYTYTVTSLEEVGVSATYQTVYGPDTTTARILLQTCDGATHRVLVHGVLTSAS